MRNVPRWPGFVALALLSAVLFAACSDDPAELPAVAGEQSQTVADSAVPDSPAPHRPPLPPPAIQRTPICFNEVDNYFFWVFSEEEGQPDLFDTPAENLLIGKRSGFAFWVDERGRKILAGVRQLNIRRNDSYDGPFDQLADNYAAEVGISELIQQAFPTLEGRIDTYGYYIDREPSVRVALSTYRQYVSTSDIMQFVAALAVVDDPYAVISRGGRPHGRKPLCDAGRGTALRKEASHTLPQSR